MSSGLRGRLRGHRHPDRRREGCVRARRAQQHGGLEHLTTIALDPGQHDSSSTTRAPASSREAPRSLRNRAAGAASAAGERSRPDTVATQRIPRALRRTLGLGRGLPGLSRPESSNLTYRARCRSAARAQEKALRRGRRGPAGLFDRDLVPQQLGECRCESAGAADPSRSCPGAIPAGRIAGVVGHHQRQPAGERLLGGKRKSLAARGDDHRVAGTVDLAQGAPATAARGR